MKRWFWGVSLAAGLSAGAGLLVHGALAQGGFFFRDGDDPVVVFGDSITQDAGYVLMIESYLLTRFPEWKVRVRNLGLGGDTAGFRRRGGFRKTFERDIKTLLPKAALFCFGMNDGHDPRDLPRYQESIDKLAGALESVGARVAILSPTAEEGEEAGAAAGSVYNGQLKAFARMCEGVAEKRGMAFVDLNAMMIGAVESARAAGIVPLSGDRALIPDGVHPGAAGHFLMACTILKRLGAKGSVSALTIDAVARRVSSRAGCTAEVDADAPGGEMAFTRRDGRLPWPAPGEAVEAGVRVPGFETALDELSDYRLAVTGLIERGRYRVLIDGEEAGVFTGGRLRDGINLSGLKGPIRAQCDELYALLSVKNDLWRERYKGVQLYHLPEWVRPAAAENGETGAEEAEFAPVGEWIEARRVRELSRLDAEIAAVEGKIEELRKPRSHRFVLRAVEVDLGGGGD